MTRNMTLGGCLLVFLMICTNVWANNQYIIKSLVAEQHQSYSTRTGRISYFKEHDLAFNSSGIIKSVNFEQGDSFIKGQVLAELDTAPLLQNVESVKANLEFVTKERNRLHILLKKGLVFASAVNEIDAKYKGLKAQLIQAQYLLDNSIITAYFDGVVLQKLAEKGEFVNLGQPLAVVASSSNNWTVQVSVSEKEFIALQQHQSVNVFLPHNQSEVEGKVRRISLEPDMHGALYKIDIEVAAMKNMVKGLKAQVILPNEMNYIYKVSHHTPIKIKGSVANILTKYGERFSEKTYAIVDMDDDFIYLQAQEPQIELVWNGWVLR